MPCILGVIVFAASIIQLAFIFFEKNACIRATIRFYKVMLRQTLKKLAFTVDF